MWLLSVLFVCGSLFAEEISYPKLPCDPQCDDYHGTLVADPYRYLEDSHHPITKGWIDEENALTENYLLNLPEREELSDILQSVFSFDRYGGLVNRGDRLFLRKRLAGQNQDVIYTMDHLEDTPRVLIDPNVLSERGLISCIHAAPSLEGNLLAYALSSNGSDWGEIKILDVATGEVFPETLKWINKKFDVTWVKGGSGFYYFRLEEPSQELMYTAPSTSRKKLYFHTVGTSQEADFFIYESSHFMDAHVTRSEKPYLLITLWEGSGNSPSAIFYQEVGDPSKTYSLLPDFDASYSYIGNVSDLLLFWTNLDAPCGKVIGVDLESKKIREIVKETKEPLLWITRAGGHLCCQYLRDASSALSVYSLEGVFERVIELPEIGSVGFTWATGSDGAIFYTFTSFTDPSSIYRCDLKTGESQVLFKSSFKDKDLYETKQVFYPSLDGTLIPMFLSYKKGTVLVGNHPVCLYGYGGFGACMTPGFSPFRIAWMEKGGIFALANIRGGGEYGDAWHNAGKLSFKQNVFDDFIGAAEWLIGEGITSASKLAIAGGSNGGLLVGACLNQRPELFGAAWAAVGVMDMLRFDKFTGGKYWISEYGSPENPEQFSCLYKYSPLHNIQKGVKYPPILVTTGDHDDRVVPMHSFKYAATLQETAGGLTLIRIEKDAGHGMGKPVSKMIDELIDILSFLSHHTK